MLLMDMSAEIRFRHLTSQESINSIARDLKLSRPAVRKHCRTQSKPVYHQSKQPTPMLGAFENTSEAWFRTTRRLFEGLQAVGIAAPTTAFSGMCSAGRQPNPVRL